MRWRLTGCWVKSPQAWALGDCEPGQEHRKTIEWEAKGVPPSSHNVPAGKAATILHQTLRAGPVPTVTAYRAKKPSLSKHALGPSGQHATGTISLAGCLGLSDKSGLLAKRFADLVRPAAGLVAGSFLGRTLSYSDLPRYHVPPHVSCRHQTSISA